MTKKKRDKRILLRVSSKQLKWWPKWASLLEMDEYPKKLIKGIYGVCQDPECKTRGCFHGNAELLSDGTLGPCMSTQLDYYRYIVPWHHTAIRWLSSRTQLLLLRFGLAIHDPIYGQCCPAFECCWREVEKSGMASMANSLIKAVKEGKSTIHVIKGGN